MKAPELTALDFITRLGFAALLGIAIGFERQWRQRSAGLHTSSLVSIGAALFAQLDLILGSGDTTRIVAGVVTGVGFIAGGVILRGGGGITGLNTAATMWATAAIGALAGFGLWTQAAAGALAVVMLNLLLQPIAAAIDVRAKKHQSAAMVYQIAVRCDAEHQADVTAAILDSVSNSAMSLQSLTRKRSEASNVDINAEIASSGGDVSRIEALSERLIKTPGVERTDWSGAES
jgi:putative Mg2+ transporter-C (MgtC) family protein